MSDFSAPVKHISFSHDRKYPGSTEPGYHYLIMIVLLLGLLNSDSHGNGHTDHGVVACAQEASEAGLPVGKILKKK